MIPSECPCNPIVCDGSVYYESAISGKRWVACEQWSEDSMTLEMVMDYGNLCKFGPSDWWKSYLQENESD